MSFSALSQHSHREESYFNPINKINKGFRKANKPPPVTTTSKRISTQQSYIQPQLSFSSLSKKNSQRQSNSKMKCFGDSSGKKKYFCGPENGFDSCRKRLTYESETSRDKSKENKMNFSNIIRKSREKSLKRSSLMGKSQKKVIQPPLAARQHPFNKLKNKLLGQPHLNEPSPTTSSPPRRAKIPSAVHQDLQLVRVSLQSSLGPSQLQLDMSPGL